jgi:hypothetical protein
MQADIAVANPLLVSFGWPRATLLELLASLGPERLAASLLKGTRTFSTYCSGMGTVEHVAVWLSCVAPDILGDDACGLTPATCCDHALVVHARPHVASNT